MGVAIQVDGHNKGTDVFISILRHYIGAEFNRQGIKKYIKLAQPTAKTRN